MFMDVGQTGGGDVIDRHQGGPESAVARPAPAEHLEVAINTESECEVDWGDSDLDVAHQDVREEVSAVVIFTCGWNTMRDKRIQQLFNQRPGAQWLAAP